MPENVPRYAGVRQGLLKQPVDTTSGDRTYGDAIAQSLRLTDVPALRTHSRPGAPIGITRISCSAGAIGMTDSIPPEDTFIVALYLTALPHHELWSRGRRVLSQGYAQNSMRIVNLENQYSALITAPHESVYFYIPRTSLDAFTEETETPRVSNLSCSPGVIDPIVSHVASAFFPAFQKPERTSTLFVDELALAFLAYLSGRYGAQPQELPRGGLSIGMERRAKEFLAARLAEDVSIAEAATACGISRGHFLRAFKKSTGTTPHRWLLAYRIEAAKSLLSDPRTNIAQVAVECGFADQSHLTRAFGLHVGTSPGIWRKSRLGKAAPYA
jgi:AraC family transcriptional regulator